TKRLWPSLRARVWMRLRRQGRKARESIRRFSWPWEQQPVLCLCHYSFCGFWEGNKMKRNSITQEYYTLMITKDGIMPPMNKEKAAAGLVAAGFLDLLSQEIIVIEKKKI